MEDKQEKIAVQITEIKDRDYHHIQVRIMLWNEHSNCWTNGCGTKYDDLVCTDQADCGAHDTASYGWDVKYLNPYSVDLHRAETMAKMLRSIDNKMAKMASVEGPVATFGHYALRFARAIGAKCLVQYRADTIMYSQSTYTEYALVDMVYKINSLTNTWHEEKNTQYWQTHKAS